MTEWHLITGEYPPQPGGVSDYTRWVALGLAAAGDTVHVWCPPCNATDLEDSGVIVHRDLGTMGRRDLFKVSRMLDEYAKPRRLLVQWVPHAFGFRSANLPLSLWIWNRALAHGDQVEVMVHEPFLPLPQDRLRHSALAIVHRLMLMSVLQAAARIWIAIPKWEDCCRPYARRGTPFKWLPVISNIWVNQQKGATEIIRGTYASSQEFLIGHFGTCRGAIGKMLQNVIPILLSRDARRVMLLIGEDGKSLRDEVLREYPALNGRLHVTGRLSDAEVSWHISACDLVLQPYPDGVSSRRSSLMAAISHGKPVVTTSGHLTEPFWESSGGVLLVPARSHTQLAAAAGDLLANPAEMLRLGKKGRDLYRRHFGLKNVLKRLRTDSKTPCDDTDLNCEDMANADSTNC